MTNIVLHVNDKTGINSLNTIFQLINITLDKLKLYSKNVRQPYKSTIGKNDLSTSADDPLDTAFTHEDVWLFLEFLNMVFFIFKEKYHALSAPSSVPSSSSVKPIVSGKRKYINDSSSSSDDSDDENGNLIRKQFVKAPTTIYEYSQDGKSVFSLLKGGGGDMNMVDIKTMVSDELLPGLSQIANKTYTLSGHCDFVDMLSRKTANAYVCAHGDFYFPQFEYETAATAANDSLAGFDENVKKQQQLFENMLDINDKVSADLFAFLRFLFFLNTHDDGTKLLLHMLTIHYNSRNSLAASVYRMESPNDIVKRREAVRLNVDNLCDTLARIDGIGRVFEPYTDLFEKVVYKCLSSWRTQIDMTSESVRNFLKLFENVREPDTAAAAANAASKSTKF